MRFNHQRNRIPPPRGPRPTSGIVVDASCLPCKDSIRKDGFFHGNVEWRIVDIGLGKVWHSSKVYQYGNINQGEYMALVDAMYLLKQVGMSAEPVYSDSLTAISWVRKAAPRSKHPLNDQTREIMELVANATEWLQEHKPGNPILFWDNVLWGENPADYGRK